MLSASQELLSIGRDLPFSIDLRITDAAGANRSTSGMTSVIRTDAGPGATV